MFIFQRFAVRCENRFASHHVPLKAGLRRVVVHRQRAKNRSGRLGSLPEIRFLANEVLRLDLWPRHARLHEVVFQVQFGAVKPVALFQSRGCAVHADAHRRDSEWLTCLPQDVPQARALFHRRIDFPPQFTYVRNPGSERPYGANVHLLARAERKGLVRHVVLGDRLHQLARVRPPHANRRPRGTRIAQLRRAIGRQVIGEPLFVARPVEDACDHTEVVRAKTHHRQVGLDAAHPIE